MDKASSSSTPELIEQDINDVTEDTLNELTVSNGIEKTFVADETDIKDNSFFPEELLMEEQRLKEENEKKNQEALLDDFNEEERKTRFKNLLILLENSTKLTNIFEARLKQCKLQIIKNELKKNNKTKENMSNESVNSTKTISDKPFENINEEDNYLNLFQQPMLFNGRLKNHQIEGLLWIRTLYENGLNGILADDMGLGKTIQTIAFYCFLIEMGVSGPFLVIAPLSTIPNWLSEFSKFAPQLPSLLYHGSENERISIRPKFKNTQKLNNVNCYPIIITTYDVVRFDINFLSTINFKFITIDEGQKLKNFNSVISKYMRSFVCTNKLILTGTPIQNDMTELWSLLNLLMPQIFNKLEDFNSWFVLDDFFNSNDKIVSMAKKDQVLDIMLKVLKPFILRREKKETDLNLPPKKEIVVYAPITETQQKLYKATLDKHMEILLNQNNKETNNVLNEETPKRKCVKRIKRYTDLFAIKNSIEQEEEENKDMAISLVMQNPMLVLKKIANHPYLIHMPLIPGKKEILVDENIIKASGKFQVLDGMLTKLKLCGHKVLLFSTMTMILDVIEEFLIYRSYKYARLDGSMQIQLRVDQIKKFNTDTDCFIMILSTRAGGLGLNLTAADTVIIFDSDWNPQCDLQAQDRCHRMGQDKPVVVYRLCSKNTIDERILNRAVAKRKLEKIIIGSGSFNKTNTKLTLIDIEELTNLLESSEYNRKIQSNGFIFTDDEFEALLDRSDMVQSTSKTNTTQSNKHFKVLNSF